MIVRALPIRSLEPHVQIDCRPDLALAVFWWSPASVRAASDLSVAVETSKAGEMGFQSSRPFFAFIVIAGVSLEIVRTVRCRISGTGTMGLSFKGIYIEVSLDLSRTKSAKGCKGYFGPTASKV